MKSEKLTSSEIIIIQMLWEGKTAKEIANSLKIEAKTVEQHKYNILKKFRVNCTVLACRRGLQLGYLEVDYDTNPT